MSKFDTRRSRSLAARPHPALARSVLAGIALGSSITLGIGLGMPSQSVAHDKSGEPKITIANGSITTLKLADAAVTHAKLAKGAVAGAVLANGAVTVEKLADGSISSAKLANTSVTQTKLANGAVSTPKLVDGSVTMNKIGVGAVNEARLANGAVTQTKLSNEVVTRAKVKPGGGVYARKGDIYVETTEFSVPNNVSLWTTATCRTAVDPPLTGTCDVPGGEQLVLRGTRAQHWTTDTTAARFGCLFSNTTGGSVLIKVNIICIGGS